MTLLELAAKVEAATGPDRELDLDIYNWLAANGFEPSRSHACYPRYAFTASIDAAMTLYPEGWLLVEMYERNTATAQNWRWKAVLWEPSTGKEVQGIARKCHVPALALTAAALRARASMEGDNEQA